MERFVIAHHQAATNKNLEAVVELCEQRKHLKGTSRYRSQPQIIRRQTFCSSLRRIPHSDLRYHPYKIQIVQERTDLDLLQEEHFVRSLLPS